MPCRHALGQHALPVAHRNPHAPRAILQRAEPLIDVVRAALAGIAGTLLNMLFCIGLIILIPLAIAAIVFPILGGLKAKDGIFWKYPLTIDFLK